VADEDEEYEPKIGTWPGPIPSEPSRSARGAEREGGFRKAKTFKTREAFDKA